MESEQRGTEEDEEQLNEGVDPRIEVRTIRGDYMIVELRIIVVYMSLCILSGGVQRQMRRKYETRGNTNEKWYKL